MRSMVVRFTQLLSTLALGLPVSCAATTPGAQPHDMSAPQHEAMAANEGKKAELHSAQYDPGASIKSERCNRGAAARTGGDEGCWTSITNATAAHLEQSQKHQKMAADHRAASQALRDSEAHACVGISAEDRDMSPFEHREDIASVEPLTVHAASSRGSSTRTVGAIITFRAIPGMTSQWLQRVVDCHLARNAAVGHDVPEMPSCPLVPNNVTAQVNPTASGFAVSVRSDDTDTAREVLRRAQTLVAR